MPRYRRRAIGFYRDSKGRVRPITPRMRRRYRYYRIGKNVLTYKPPKLISSPIRQIETKEPLIRVALNSVLYQTPIVRELHSAYILADSIYSNWSLIKELYESYRKEGLAGVVDSEAVHYAVSSIQTNIIWGVIKGVIPERFHDKSLDILSTVVDKITDEEMRYVKSYLQETK